MHMQVTHILRFWPYIGVMFITCTKAKLCFQEIFSMMPNFHQIPYVSSVCRICILVHVLVTYL